MHIGSGHSFEKHIVVQGEFLGWIRTRAQFLKHLENVVADPNTLYRTVECPQHKTLYGCPKKVYYQESTNTLIINDPHAFDKGTAYQPIKGIQEFYEIDKK